MTVLDEAANVCKEGLRTERITAYAIVTVDENGVIERNCFCAQTWAAAAELLGAVSLLSKGTTDFYERLYPPRLIVPPEPEKPI